MPDKEPSELRHLLAQTKFHPPLLREDVIPRESLLDDLRQRITGSALTLISAPAGYGKTTLLAALTARSRDLPFAWLSLDEEDNDPARFLAALIAALQQLEPLCGVTAASLLTSPIHRGGEVRRVMSVLINDVVENLNDPFALVLDDLHQIRTPSIFVALDYLLEQRPPPLHLVVATRVDPPLALARLRAQGELSELRLADLRFRYEEAAAFLKERLREELPDTDVRLLQSQTEGWPVGLRLLASSLERIASQAERKNFLRHLAQRERHIFEFLAEEVFNQQEAVVRTFLLETAILAELSPALCAAVTGRVDAGTMLRQLYRRNLFLVQVQPRGSETLWQADDVSGPRPRFETSRSQLETRYRYHDLFAEFLRRKLEQERPERVSALHLRAARAEKDAVRAVGHYLAAGRWAEAAALIEQIGAELFARGYLDTLARWIRRLPAAVRARHPRLLHYLSNCIFWRGGWGEVQTLLERALQGFEAAGDEAGQGEVIADLATCAVSKGEMERGLALFGEALSYPIPAHIRVQALLGRALTEGAWGNWRQTERDFKAAMALVEERSDLDPLYLVMFPFFHPDFAFLPGGLTQLERICRQAGDQLGDEVSPSRLMVEEMATVLHLFRGELDEAIRVGQGALALRKRLGGHPYLSLNAAVFLMIAYAARGEYGAVEPLFDVLFLGIDQTVGPPADLPIYLFYAGRVRWLQRRPAEARALYTQMRRILEEGPLREAPEFRICDRWLASLLALAEGRSDEAERWLREPEVLEQRDRGSRVHGSTRLMLARLYHRQKRLEEALAELEPVLTYHEQLGIPLPILLEGQSVVPLLRLALEEGIHERYAASLLDMLGARDEPGPVELPESGVTLTPREVEVLGLVASGYSNRTIAEELVISEWTVKSHLTKVYRKLEVGSRTQAVLRARELGLG